MRTNVSLTRRSSGEDGNDWRLSFPSLGHRPLRPPRRLCLCLLGTQHDRGLSGFQKDREQTVIYNMYSDGVHLICTDGIPALHLYCERIGIKRCWFHSSSRFPHYDIPKKKRATFFTDHPEVKRVTARQIVTLLKPTL